MPAAQAPAWPASRSAAGWWSTSRDISAASSPTKADRVRVQPGVVLDESLNRYLRQSGRLFGPDPAMRSVTTMGSVVAIDAGGSHWPRYGSARRHVEELQVVLADGTVLRVGRHSITHASNGCTAKRRQRRPRRTTWSIPSPVSSSATRERSKTVARKASSIAAAIGSTTSSSDGQLDLARLLVGSEGTLALITEATVSVDPLPLHRSCVLLLFESLDKAAHAALEIAALEPAACDLMDRRHLSLARETDVRYELLIPGEAEAVLLVEYHADSRDELRHKLDEVVELVQFKLGLAAASHIAEDESRLSIVLGPGPAIRADAPSHARLIAADAVHRRHRRAGRGSARFSAARAGHAQASAGHGVGLRPRGPRPAAHSPVSRSATPTTMSARWNRWPPSFTKKSGCSAARSAASTATA